MKIEHLQAGDLNPGEMEPLHEIVKQIKSEGLVYCKELAQEAVGVGCIGTSLFVSPSIAKRLKKTGRIEPTSDYERWVNIHYSIKWPTLNRGQIDRKL